MKEDQYKRIYDCVVNGKAAEALKIGEDMKAAGISVQDVGKVLIDAMNLVGHRYREREIALPQLILATHCFKKILVPYVADARGNSGVVVIGTVKNDIHDIGKNLVVSMLTVYNYKVIDLGKDVPLEKFVTEAKKNNADIVGAGTLLTATMPELSEVLAMMKEEGMIPKVKFAVGGAPLTTTYAKHIGADGYAADAILAVEMANHLMKGEQSYQAAMQK
jgi:5-methyltetrahydrofolate--homocysteine methyltransferase